jgi:hypothetical protein
MTDKDILDEAKDRYKEAVTGWQHIYDEATDDIKFVYDVDEGQWPEDIRKKRAAAGRPIITVNKLQKTLRRIRGDHKMNPTQLKAIPVDDKADPQKAELYNGLLRQIEYLSDAEIAYDTAYNHAISSSIGFFRIITKYSKDDNFEQDIFIRRIINPMAVHFDPYAQEFNLEDARYCFIEDLVDKKVYEALYGKNNLVDFDSNRALFGEWMVQDKIRVAEYFYKEPYKKKIVQLETGEIIPITGKVTIDALRHMGQVIKRERTIDAYKVMWCKINGVDILEKSEWPTDDIPVIPMFGDEVVAEGKRYYLSLARGAKGPQQMYNYWSTAATETVALAPKMPFIVDHRQIKGFENEWEDANTENRMYIRYNAVAGLQKPSKEPQAQIPSAIINMMQQTAYDVEDHLGQYESSKGETSNERSGKAINARIAQSDKGTYLFIDNSTRAKVAAGKQLIKLIPKIYDTERAVRIKGDNGEEKLVTVNKPVGFDEKGAVAMENDLSVGTFDLIATTGASYSSRRQEMVDTLLQSLQYSPGLANIIAPMIFKYSDDPASQEVYEEIKKGIAAQQQMQMQAEAQGMKGPQ